MTNPTYTPPAHMTAWTPADLAAQPLAAMLGIAPLVKPPYVPRGGDMTPEELAAFETRMERLRIESESWPLPDKKLEEIDL